MIISIDKLVYGGKGLGRLPDGRCVFVPRVCAGEKVEIDLLKNKSDFCEGILQEILKPSSERTQPLCPCFFECGGCDFQHILYEKQLFWKMQFVRESFARMGKFSAQEIDSVFHPIVGTDHPFAYRNKTEFFFFEQAGKWKLGLHRFQDNALFEVPFCLLHSPLAQQVLSLFHEFLKQDAFQKIAKNLFSLIIRTNEQGHVLVILTILEKTNISFGEWGKILQQKLGASLVGVLVMAKKGSDDGQLLYGDKKIKEKVLNLDFEIGGRSFFQVHNFMAEKMVSHVRERIFSMGKKLRVLDLFCGSGFLGLAIARDCKSVIGIDLEVSSIEEGRITAQKNKTSNYLFHSGDAESVLKKLIDEGQNFEVAIVDPPRRGLGKHLCDILLQSKVSHIIYISCDPVTLARDVRYLVDAGFMIQSILPFDMFPQTTHVESVVVLSL